MTIKNPHIIHFIKKETTTYLDRKWRYICSGSYTKEKSTRKESEVTCENCLKVLKKRKKGGKKK